MAACNTCSKEEPAVQLKRCAKCSTTQYCSRDCQKADWKAHKRICGKQADSVANANIPDPDEMSQSPKKGLETSVPNPFTRLDNGTYLHNRPEKDIYRLLIDTYRLRMDDMYNLEGQADGDSLYGGASNGLRGFQRFLRQASVRRGLLPSWWSPEKQQECEQLGMDSSQWQNLTKKTSKQEIIDYYGDPRFPMQLRMVGEAVYLSAPGGGDGSQMRKMMAAMEGGGMEGMGMSMMDASLMRR